MSEDNCPFCGARRGEGEVVFLRTSDMMVDPVWFTCGTIIRPVMIKAPSCYENRITDLRARLAECEEKLEIWEGSI